MSFLRKSVSSLVLFWLRMASRSFLDLAAGGWIAFGNMCQLSLIWFGLDLTCLVTHLVWSLWTIALMLWTLRTVGSPGFLQLPALPGPSLQLGGWCKSELALDIKICICCKIFDGPLNKKKVIFASELHMKTLKLRLCDVVSYSDKTEKLFLNKYQTLPPLREKLGIYYNSNSGTIFLLIWILLKTFQF